MRLHDLRHGAATLLVGAGVHPRVAQQLLRHASSKTTTEIYSHVTAAQERQAAEVLEAALGGVTRATLVIDATPLGHRVVFEQEARPSRGRASVVDPSYEGL